MREIWTKIGRGEGMKKEASEGVKEEEGREKSRQEDSRNTERRKGSMKKNGGRDG